MSYDIRFASTVGVRDATNCPHLTVLRSNMWKGSVSAGERWECEVCGTEFVLKEEGR